ncbi:hypothetical protein J1N35_019011 [Gossypium stocksii]|uniref:Uncharacterized protein n=1 Tax=Gossypium stocksii TaxID=47602 RepID=A0A9D3VQ21_9ROSI|nr:hypothetical protein J1N35_019011 [Gossypium stocksii]
MGLSNSAPVNSLEFHSYERTSSCWHRVNQFLFPRYHHYFFSGKISSQPVGLLPPYGIVSSYFRQLQRIPHCCLLSESELYLSFSMADHSLGPAIDHRLGKLLLHQLANQMRTPPRADSSFCFLAYRVLATVSNCCSPSKGRFLCITHSSATGNITSCLTCMC